MRLDFHLQHIHLFNKIQLINRFYTRFFFLDSFFTFSFLPVLFSTHSVRCKFLARLLYTYFYPAQPGSPSVRPRIVLEVHAAEAGHMESHHATIASGVFKGQTAHCRFRLYAHADDCARPSCHVSWNSVICLLQND